MKKVETKKGGAKGRAKKPSARLESLIDGVAKGKTPPKAAKDAGFSDSYARVDVYRTLANPSVRQRIAEKRAVLTAQADVERAEIVGALVGQMRSDLADVFPQDEILKAAKESGVSHLIKKLKVTRRFIPQKDGEPIEQVTHEIEMYSAQEAAKQLCSVFGLNKKEAENPETAARSALRSIMSKLGLSEAEAAPIVAAEFGVSEAELISEANN